MPRRVRRNRKKEPYPDWFAPYFIFGETDSPAIYFVPPDALRDGWAELRDDLLQTFITEYPGARPWAWWHYDAPRAPLGMFRGWCDGTLAAPRMRLGGTGTPAHEALNYVPAFEFGIPVDWVDAWSVAYYSGRALDVHGQRIGTEYFDGHFPYFAIDPNDPPTFESEAAYLQRHGLLSTPESRHADFEPETIIFLEDHADAD